MTRSARLVLLGLAVWLLLRPALRAADPPVTWWTGENLRVAIGQKIGVTWSNISLRRALTSLSKSRQVAIILDRRVDLVFHVRGQVVAVHHPHPAGVDQLEELRLIVRADLDQRAQTIPGDARDVVYDRDPPAGQPVQERGLSDVGSAHDHDFRESHGDTRPPRWPWRLRDG